MKKFYITCAIPYVNSVPHVGHALEFVQGDTIARYHRLLGQETLLLCGGDENALKNVQAAEKANIPVQQFIDENNIKFFELTKQLGCQFDVWQREATQTIISKQAKSSGSFVTKQETYIRNRMKDSIAWDVKHFIRKTSSTKTANALNISEKN